jgi:glycosyltransferase involved in cell wall biosynthesis
MRRTPVRSSHARLRDRTTRTWTAPHDAERSTVPGQSRSARSSAIRCVRRHVAQVVTATVASNANTSSRAPAVALPSKAGGFIAIDAGHCVLRYPNQTHVLADVERRMTLSRSLAAADAIVVVSDYMRGLLLDAEPHLDARLHLLSRPIRDLGKLRIRHRTRPEDPAVVTYAGRITAEKGLAVVVEALGAARCHGPVELRIAGVIEGHDYWSHCQQLQSEATARNPGLTITYLGHLDYDAIDEQYRQSDIVAIPSRWPEPLGAVALEAMSARAAVIASNVGGLSDTIGDDHNGLRAIPGDADSWANALTTLLQRPDDARRLGHQGHRDFASITIGETERTGRVASRLLRLIRGRVGNRPARRGVEGA